MSQPSQVENESIFVGVNGRVRALNITEGTVRTMWTTKLSRDYMVHLQLHNDRLYAANSVWKEKPHHSGQFVSLFLSSDGSILISACYGSITAFNPVNSNTIWELKIHGFFRAGGSYILAEQNGVLFMGNNGHVWALNLQKGRLIWKNKLKGFGFCPISLAPHGDKLYVGTAGCILSLDSRTGATQNRYTIRSTGYNPVTLLIDVPSNLLFAATIGKLVCCKADHLTELWKSNLPGMGNSSGISLLSSDSQTIAIGMNGKIALVNKSSGDVVWQKKSSYVWIRISNCCNNGKP